VRTASRIASSTGRTRRYIWTPVIPTSAKIAATAVHPRNWKLY